MTTHLSRRKAPTRPAPLASEMVGDMPDLCPPEADLVPSTLDSVSSYLVVLTEDK